MIKLRDYQEKAIEDIRKEFRAGNRKVLLGLPTGGGKTCIATFMISEAAKKGLRCVFTCHRRELVDQTAKMFHENNIDFGIVAAGSKTIPGKLVQIALIQTLTRRLHTIPQPNLLIIDEAHHAISKTWKRVHDTYPESWCVGLSGSPARLDGRGLGDIFDVIVQGPDTQKLILSGNLSRYKYYAPSAISLEGVRTSMGDYKISDIEDVMDKPTITGDAIREYLRYGRDGQFVIFCVSIKHSKNVTNAFNEAGIEARHIDGKMNAKERDGAVEAFRRGEIKILSNCEIVFEGFDIPNLTGAILLRPTKSLTIFLQQVGRALRPSPGKPHAVILDHVQNYRHHGFPDDERQWSLHSKKKSQRENIAPIKICPNCMMALPISTLMCPCGTIFESKQREVEEVDGKLEELDPATVKRQRKREQGKAQTLEALVELGQRRGYKHPRGWALNVLKFRNRGK